MSVALAAGCQKADTAETTVTVETTAEQSTETESTSPAESETSDDAEILKNYHLLQGVIVKTDSEKGTFTVKTDDGAEYTLATENIHDVETEIADDSVVALWSRRGCVLVRLQPLQRQSKTPNAIESDLLHIHGLRSGDDLLRT